MSTRMPKGDTVTAVVVYKHPMLRDVVVRVLSDCGVRIAAVVEVEDVSPLVLLVARPSLVVVDREALGPAGDIREVSGLEEARLASPIRVVVAGLNSRYTRVYTGSAQSVADATLDSLVEAVVGSDTISKQRGTRLLLLGGQAGTDE